MSEQRHGAWWAPESPTERVSGSLTGVGGAWRLTLVGGFQVDRGGDGLHLVPPTTINKPGTTESTNDQWVTTWRVGSLVRGGHVRDTTRFSSAFFEITGLPAWWPLSGLRGPQVRPGPYVAPEDVVASLDNGSITIGVRDERLSGRRMKSVRERVIVRASRTPGSPWTTSTRTSQGR